MITEKQIEIQKAYKEFFKELSMKNAPEFFVTLTLKRIYSDKAALSTFNFFIKRIQKRLPIKNETRGIAFIERTWKKASYEGQQHIHALLWGLDESIDDPEGYLNELANMSAESLLDDMRREMAELKTLDVQRVYDIEGASVYCVKDITRYSTERRTKIFLITKNGLNLENQLH